MEKIRILQSTKCLLFGFSMIFASLMLGVASIPLISASGILNDTVNNTQDPPLLIPGREKQIIAHPRENVELTCPIRCHPPCIFHWTKRNESIIQWDRFYYPTESKLQLQIRTLESEDSGSYECLGVNGFGSTSTKIQLIVEGELPIVNNLIKRTGYNNGTIPEILINLLPTDQVIYIYKGDSLSLKCQAIGFPSPYVTWFKNNLYLLGPSDNVSFLKLTNVTEKDSGSYKCEAENEFGKSYYVINLKVTGGGLHNYYGSRAEILSLTPSNLSLVTGENGSLTCVVRSDALYTKPLILWFKRLQTHSQSEEKVLLHQGEPLEVLNRTLIVDKSPNTYSTTLVFTNVTRSKAGTYVCVVLTGPTTDEFEQWEATLVVGIAIEEKESVRDRTAKVQWTLLWTFGFVMVAVLIITSFSRSHHICRWKPKPLFPVSRFSEKAETSRIIGGVPIPSKSPGETVSTILTHHKEILEPFIENTSFMNDGLKKNNEMSSTSPDSSLIRIPIKHYLYSPIKHQERRINSYNSSESNSLSDSIYESGSQFEQTYQKIGYSYPVSSEETSSFDLQFERMHYKNINPYMEPPCTPVTTYSVNSVI